MEMYQQLDMEKDNLEAMKELHHYERIKLDREQKLKEQVSKQFVEWHKMLNQAELEFNNQVHLRFTKFEQPFEDQKQQAHQFIEAG